MTRRRSFQNKGVITCWLVLLQNAASIGAFSTRQPPSRHATSTQLQVFNVAPEESILMEQTSTREILDGILDDCLRTSSRKPIMIQFEPSSKAIWSHYKGTVFAETWPSCVQGILWAAAVYVWCQQRPQLLKSLSDMTPLYAHLLSVTTFTLTFFVNQSYTIWRTCLQTCRILQGRLNDLVMALAGFSERIDESPTPGSSTFTPNARNMLTIFSRYVRLFHILAYASLTRSHRPLLTPQGMRRMVARGLLTSKERTILIESNIPATQRHNAVLMWMLRLVVESRKAGIVLGGVGVEQVLLDKIHTVRAQGNSMESTLKGRMPFAYAHFVQILVDAILWLYPLVAVTRGASFALTLMGSALMTLSFQGLFDLAKRFLDPFFNESFWRGDDPLIVDTLIAETNAGSMRWRDCLEEMPISFRNINKGTLEDSLLPEEGFTREEAEEADAKRAEKEVAALSAKERTERLVEAIETAEEEFEETKRILNAPPGSDFITNEQDNGNGDMNERNDDDDDDFDGFLEAAEDELEEGRRRAEV